MSMSGDREFLMASTSSTSGNFAWWFMQCDRNHTWRRLLDSSVEPDAESLTCPVDGTEAVTASRRPLADRVRISLIPLSWQVGGEVGGKDTYLIEISANAFPSETLRSSRSFSWEESISRIAWFKDIPWESAKKRWIRGGFDSRNENDS
jgi:hypothetical protein